MKNRSFGKMLSLVLAVTMLFALSSCGKSKPTEYDITGKSDLSVTDTTFDGDVIITGEGGIISFVNCVFNGNIVNKGGEGARVFLLEGCEFADDSVCVIESSLEEATFESDLPKFLVFCEAAPISCENAGAVITFPENEIEFNGKKYPIENAELFNDETTGEIVPFSGQDASLHNVAKWTENGEEILLHLAIYSE